MDNLEIFNDTYKVTYAKEDVQARLKDISSIKLSINLSKTICWDLDMHRHKSGNRCIVEGCRRDQKDGISDLAAILSHVHLSSICIDLNHSLRWKYDDERGFLGWDFDDDSDNDGEAESEEEVEKLVHGSLEGHASGRESQDGKSVMTEHEKALLKLLQPFTIIRNVSRARFTIAGRGNTVSSVNKAANTNIK